MLDRLDKGLIGVYVVVLVLLVVLLCLYWLKQTPAPPNTSTYVVGVGGWVETPKKNEYK